MFLFTTDTQCIYTAGVNMKSQWNDKELVITTLDKDDKELRRITFTAEEAATLTMEKR